LEHASEASALSISTFGWLDHDDGERRRMMEVVNLFREKGTLDELGVGSIRDTLAEHFFPGTSTIQTRARYFLFIPWIYSMLEHNRVPSRGAAIYARKLQWQLVQSLQAGGESSGGVIGIDAGENLNRLPSTIYWQGIMRWEIRSFEGSTDRYHASLDQYYRAERSARSSDSGELLDAAHRNWHGSLPSAPTGFLSQTTFALQHHEAEFLSERIRRASPDSLLAACLSSSITRRRIAHAPWELTGLGGLPSQLCADVESARLYSLTMEGAVLLYNLMLAELAVERAIHSDTRFVDRYRQELERWGDEMESAQSALQNWDRQAFWARLRAINPRLQSGAIRFSDTWLSLAIAAPGSVSTSNFARILIRERERLLKTTLARLYNPRALERWPGESGLGRLTFRWTNAKRILIDILDGLREPASSI